MLFVRPGRLSDLSELAAMACVAHPMLLSPNQRALEARLALSQSALHTDVDTPGEEFYLFVLEDADSGRLLGTASIAALAGYVEPFWAFRNDVLIHASRELHVRRRIQTLIMSHQLSSYTWLTSYYLDMALPAAIAELAASLLSRARLMFIGQHRQRFAPDLFTVLAGVKNGHDISPFWEAVGYKFFKRDLTEIERLSGGGRNQTFIAELMPFYPLYVPLLPLDTQSILGEPHPSAVLPYAIHAEDGFEADHFIDIFDAGPVLTTHVAVSKTMQRAMLRHAVRAQQPAHEEGVPYLISNTLADEFRCVVVHLACPATRPLPDKIMLPDAVLNQLLLVGGDTVYCTPLFIPLLTPRTHLTELSAQGAQS